MLDDVKQKMLDAVKMTTEAVELDYEHAALYRAEGQAKESRFKKPRFLQPAIILRSCSQLVEEAWMALAPAT